MKKIVFAEVMIGVSNLRNKAQEKRKEIRDKKRCK